MFDFIRRIFRETKSQHARRQSAQGDVMASNEIEILKTSDYSQGASAAAIEQLVAEQELPPAELNLPACDLTLPSERELPTAELDLPTYELDEPTLSQTAAVDETVELQSNLPNNGNEAELQPHKPISADTEETADNYLLGDLEGARKQREMQTRKAAVQYWSEGLQKYRRREERRTADGTTGPQLNYFDVLRNEPMLRQVELQHPGMSIEHLNLSRFIHNSMKGKLVSDFVLRNMRLIQQQQESGITPDGTVDSNGGALARDIHQRTLRDMFSAFESEIRGRSSAFEAEVGSAEYDGTDLTPGQIDELLQHFEEIFETTQLDDNRESYNRWLLKVAEEATVSSDILWLLVEDENPDVRFCLAENYNIDPNILKALIEDENPYVAHRARKTLMRLQSNNTRVVDRDFSPGDNQNRLRKMG